MRYSTKAWIGLVAYVLVAEALAPPDDMMSHAFDRWLQDHFKAVVLGALATTLVCHLFNITPPQVDVFSYAFRLVNWIGGKLR